METIARQLPFSWDRKQEVSLAELPLRQHASDISYGGDKSVCFGVFLSALSFPRHLRLILTSAIITAAFLREPGNQWLLNL